MSETMTDRDLREKEWQASRNVIASFDDRLDGLRRYGFTFITGLLTAQSLLESNLILGTAGGDASTIQPSVKVAIMLATLILILTLRVLDRNYQMFQKAAIKRAEVIEKSLSLNLGLTETISDVYYRGHLWVCVDIIYGLFAGATCLLGLFLLEGTDWAEDLMLVATSATLIGILLIRVLIRFRGGLDYTFDKLKITKGDSLIITVTNLGDEMLIPKGSLKWYMQPQDGQPLPEQENTADLVLREDEAYYIKYDIPATIAAGFYYFVVKGFHCFAFKNYFIVKKYKKKDIKGVAVRRRIQVLPPSPPTPESTPAPPTPRATQT